MNTLSLCMIVKNEEDSLPRCLASARPVCDEIIVVDTGSSDGTISVAEEYGARIFRREWENDFSLARNASLEPATGTWILWLDADDIVPPPAQQQIQRLKSEFATNMAFGFRIKNSIDGKAGDAFSQIRMFPNRPEIRFENRVHEQVLPSIQRLGIKTAFTDVVIHHTGYHTAEARKQKQERNILLLRREIEEKSPPHPVALYLYAGALRDLDRVEESIPYYEKAFQEAKDQDAEIHVFEHSPLVLAEIALQRGDEEQAEKWLKIAKENTPHHILYHLHRGRLAERKGDMQQAREAYELVLCGEEKPSLIPIDYRMIKIQTCSLLGKLLGSVFKDKQRMREILDLAIRLAGNK